MKTKFYISLYISLLFFAIMLVNCNKNDEEQQPTNINPVNLAKGETTPVLDNGNFVVKNTTDWDNLLTNFSQGVNINYVFSQTGVDFSQYMVIAVIDMGHGNGGWSIDITDITETATNIEVSYTNINKGDDTLIAIQPFHVVKIPKSNKPVIFIRN